MFPEDQGGFDGDIGAAAGQLLHFRDDVALLRIEHDIRTHLFRHLHPHRIALDADDERRAHQFRARRRAKSDRSLREDDPRCRRF